MDLGAISWTVITVLGVITLSLVVAVAMFKNRSSKEEIARSEQATRDLYKEEDRIHRDDDDGRI